MPAETWEQFFANMTNVYKGKKDILDYNVDPIRSYLVKEFCAVTHSPVEIAMRQIYAREGSLAHDRAQAVDSLIAPIDIHAIRELNKEQVYKVVDRFFLNRRPELAKKVLSADDLKQYLPEQLAQQEVKDVQNARDALATYLVARSTWQWLDSSAKVKSLFDEVKRMSVGPEAVRVAAFNNLAKYVREKSPLLTSMHANSINDLIINYFEERSLWENANPDQAFKAYWPYVCPNTYYATRIDFVKDHTVKPATSVIPSSPRSPSPRRAGDAGAAAIGEAYQLGSPAMVFFKTSKVPMPTFRNVIANQLSAYYPVNWADAVIDGIFKSVFAGLNRGLSKYKNSKAQKAFKFLKMVAAVLLFPTRFCSHLAAKLASIAGLKDTARAIARGVVKVCKKLYRKAMGQHVVPFVPPTPNEIELSKQRSPRRPSASVGGVLPPRPQTPYYPNGKEPSKSKELSIDTSLNTPRSASKATYSPENSPIPPGEDKAGGNSPEQSVIGSPTKANREQKTPHSSRKQFPPRSSGAAEQLLALPGAVVEKVSEPVVVVPAFNQADILRAIAAHEASIPELKATHAPALTKASTELRSGQYKGKFAARAGHHANRSSLPKEAFNIILYQAELAGISEQESPGGSPEVSPEQGADRKHITFKTVKPAYKAP